MNKSNITDKDLNLLSNIQHVVKKNMNKQHNIKKKTLGIEIPPNNTNKIFNNTVEFESPKICHTTKNYYY